MIEEQGLQIERKAAQIITLARVKQRRLATVESCTGGLIVGSLTEVVGASDVVEGGFITYANSLKMAVVGVEACLLEKYGAVSQEVAIAMAEGGLQASIADLAIAVTGIAGPGGATPKKPVGLVYFALACKKRPTLVRMQRFGALRRQEIRLASVAFALNFILDGLSL